MEQVTMITGHPKPATIQCDRCEEWVEYQDDGATVDCMPDGVLVLAADGSPGWVCSECMVDDDGNTLPEFS